MSSLGTSVTTEANEDGLATAIGDARKVKRWVQEIKFYETKAERWEERGKKILRRFKDDRSPREQKVPRYNILWSIVESSRPALFSANPKPNVERRFRDKDDLGRVSSMVLERAITYFVNEDFGDAVRQAVDDRLLPGRGVVWVRYEPHFKDSDYDENEEVEDEGEEITDNTEGEESDEEDKVSEADDGEDHTEVANEIVAWDYVHWQDFGHSFGRTWDEVPAAWRKVYLTRDELCERFGDEIGDKIVLDYSPHDLKDNKYDEVEKKATIYEIWDKADKKAIWIHKDYAEGALDEQDDPLQLEGFWPFPRPLFATLANDDCIPTPDYVEYQDQANELDELTSRIGSITKAVKVAGVYDKSAAGIERLLAEGVENQLIPVDQWAIFAEKGGMKGVMELLPMQEIMVVLQGLYEGRDKVKQDLYEISGSADIMRGQSDPDETFGAQKIKSQFGTMRLTAKQDQVKRFCRDLVKIGTEIIANHFSIETIKKICGVELLTDEEKALVQFRMKALQQYKQQNAQVPPGQPPIAQPPPLPPLPDWLQKCDQEDMEELMDNPTWEDVEKLFEDDITMSYKIDIETDSTIKFDQETEMQAKVQFLSAVGGFLSSAMQNQNQDLAPLLAKLLEFGVRGFRIGKELETAFDIAIHKLEKDASKGPKPSPEMMKIQAQGQLDQQKMQADAQLRQQEQQNEAKLEMMKSQAEDKRIQLQAQADALEAQNNAKFEQLKLSTEDQFNRWKAQLESETKLAVAAIAAKASLQTAQISKQTTPEEGGLSADESGNVVKQPSMADLMLTVTQQLQQALQSNSQGIAQSHQALAQVLSKPKRVMRDENGNIVGVQ